MKLISIITIVTILAAPSAFGNKLHFENIEVSSGMPPLTIVQLQRIVYSSNQLIKKPHTHAHFCVCLTPP